MSDIECPKDSTDFKDEIDDVATQQQKNYQLSENDALKTRYLRAEVTRIEKRGKIAEVCYKWVITATFLSAICLAILLRKAYYILNHLNESIHHEHLLIFLISLFSAYTLLGPYLMLKSILIQKAAIELPYTDIAKDTLKDGIKDILQQVK